VGARKVAVGDVNVIGLALFALDFVAVAARSEKI
jgi:hypothetical protein